MRAGSLGAPVKGGWASVVSDRPLELTAVVRVTDASGTARDVGTVETLRVDGTYSGQAFSDEIPGR